MKIDVLREKAAAGDADAQAGLGWLYATGKRVSKSYKQAFQWYLKAARQGHAVASYDLNLCYLLGQGIDQDDKQAFRWVKKSAEAGYPDAVLALAWHYHGGRGVRANLKQAEHWYRKSARTGESKALFSLGQLFYDLGRYAEAKQWFLKGVSQNHPRSNYYLGRMHLDGLGVRKDATKARHCLRTAARLHALGAKRLLHSKRLKKELASQKLG